eukprot:CAMPEP_0114455434 /NCGR_PEP_ID=MMETSP0104-20121206/3097_1 /TAXON_ID=37642 ORGANISM="Paraphysomonas imperforata, Strain PA2" /NCGR_SAMPLE_ID=MMETSP0104 /ASSEMBLY_ACC=CAM_ASM_000202 /LENGTH=37 /DNA_ID= /DNA_START= /DNA_END= /DNA_ORIENTATION=
MSELRKADPISIVTTVLLSLAAMAARQLTLVELTTGD